MTLGPISPDSSIMLRMFLIAVIAVSVAIAPVSGRAAISVTPAQMSMPDGGDMPCCPADESKASLTCALKCLNVAAALIPIGIALPDFIDRPQLSFADETLHGHVSQPAHPPPI